MEKRDPGSVLPESPVDSRSQINNTQLKGSVRGTFPALLQTLKTVQTVPESRLRPAIAEGFSTPALPPRCASSGEAGCRLLTNACALSFRKRTTGKSGRKPTASTSTPCDPPVDGARLIAKCGFGWAGRGRALLLAVRPGRCGEAPGPRSSASGQAPRGAELCSFAGGACSPRPCSDRRAVMVTGKPVNKLFK